MAEFDKELGRVTIDEVERIIQPEGDVSIMKFSAHRLELLEGVVAFLRNSGMFTPVEKYEEQRGIEKPEENPGKSPITVYLACLAVPSDLKPSSN